MDTLTRIATVVAIGVGLMTLRSRTGMTPGMSGAPPPVYSPGSYAPGAPPGASTGATIATAAIGSGTAIATALWGSGSVAGGAVAGGAAIGGMTIAIASGIAAAGGILAWGIVSRGWFRGGEEALHVNPARDEVKRFFALYNPYPDALTNPNGPGFFGLAWLLNSLAGSRGDAIMTAFNAAQTRRDFENALRDIEALVANNTAQVEMLRQYAVTTFIWNR